MNEIIDVLGGSAIVDVLSDESSNKEDLELLTFELQKIGLNSQVAKQTAGLFLNGEYNQEVPHRAVANEIVFYGAYGALSIDKHTLECKYSKDSTPFGEQTILQMQLLAAL